MALLPLPTEHLSEIVGEYVNEKIFERVGHTLSNILGKSIVIEIQILENIAYTYKSQFKSEMALIKQDNFNYHTQNEALLQNISKGLVHALPELHETHLLDILVKRQLVEHVPGIDIPIVKEFLHFQDYLINKFVSSQGIHMNQTNLIYLKHYIYGGYAVFYDLSHSIADIIGVRVEQALNTSLNTSMEIIQNLFNKHSQITQEIKQHVSHQYSIFPDIPFSKDPYATPYSDESYELTEEVPKENKIPITIKDVNKLQHTQNKPYSEKVITCFKSIINNFDWGSLINIVKGHHNMTSSQFDKTVIRFITNTVNNFTLKIDNAIMNCINNVIKDCKLHDKDLLNILVNNFKVIFQDIPDQFVMFLSEMVNNRNFAKMFINLLAESLKYDFPILGQLLMTFDILSNVLNIFKKTYVVAGNIQGLNFSIVIKTAIHSSLKRIGTVYSGHVKIDLFDIDIHGANKNNEKDAIKDVSTKVETEIKKKAFKCTGLPYEVFLTDNDFNHPNTLYESYKNLRFFERCFNAWCDINDISEEQRGRLNDYYNGFDENSTFWDKHKHENPILFLINLFNELYSTPLPLPPNPEQYSSIISDIKKKQTTNTLIELDNFESNERPNFNNGVAQYSRNSIFLYANFKMLLDDISIGNLSNVGANTVESVILNFVVYLDVEIKSLVSKPLNYTYNKIEDLFKTYQQIYFTRMTSVHLTSLCIYTDIPNTIVEHFISPNIGIISGLIVSYVYTHNPQKKFNIEHFTDVCINAIKVNIISILNYLNKSIKFVFNETDMVINCVCGKDNIIWFCLSTYLPKILSCKVCVLLLNYLPALFILLSTRLIKYHMFDKYRIEYENIINSINLLENSNNNRKQDEINQLYKSKHILKSKKSTNYQKFISKKIIKRHEFKKKLSCNFYKKMNKI